MKRLTMSESAYELYRLKLAKKVFRSGLVPYLAHRRDKKAVLQDVREFWAKKILA